MAAIEMHTDGEGMVRQLLEAGADVNLRTKVISMPTSRVFSTRLHLADLISAMWRILRLLTIMGGFCNGRVLYH